jgi:hypothetical protein
LTHTLNTWAEAQESAFRVSAKGGADKQTGIAMVTVSLTKTETEFKTRPIPRDFARLLNEFHRVFAQDHGTLLYHRDIFLFQGRQIHIIRPNILLNWTRTAALNDAVRIYSDIYRSREAR